MADEERREGAPHSLRDQTADQIRNEQRGGDASAGPGAEDGPEASATLRKVWSEPGGEALAYRNAMVGAGGKADDHADLVAAETPETHRHLSDASLGMPKPQGAAAESIDRATASVGHDVDDERSGP